MTNDEFSTKVLDAIKRLGRATRAQLQEEISGIKPHQVENGVKTLIRRRQIQNVSGNACKATYTADMSIIAPPRVKKARKQKEEETEKYVGVITPGTMINKMSGIYVPTRTQPMRPGAMDHEACKSLRTDGLKPYTGQFLTLGVKAK